MVPMANETERAAKRLPVGKVLLGAVQLPWRDRGKFARTLAVPFVFQVLVVLVWRISSGNLESLSAWLLAAVSFALYVQIAVRCHRLMLLEESADSAWHLPTWTLRETRFIIYVLAIWVVKFAIAWTLLYLFATPVANLLWGDLQEKALPYFPLVAGALAYYPISRMSLALPATATDKHGNFRKAWAQSRGNGLRLVIVVGVLPAIASNVSRATDFQGQNLLLDVLQQVLVYGFVVVEVAALSLSYRELR
jgi:hypothetical protein